MKKVAAIFLLAYYAFGIFCLPMGDFSVVKDIPEMYRHCKAIEDKDMTPLDFITDHLVNIDGIFDHHAQGDEQKPHASQSQHPEPFTFFQVSFFTFVIKQFNPLQTNPIIPAPQFLPSDYISNIFRPPIV